jgi:hypothetical protein
MKAASTAARILAPAGTVFSWLPLLAPLGFGLGSLATGGGFRLDWLMPAELFPLALFGGILLLIGAVVGNLRKALIAWSITIAVVFLLASQGLAMSTGLASGEIEPSGWPFVATLALFAAFVAALLVQAVAGILLCRDAFRKPKEEGA